MQINFTTATNTSLRRLQSITSDILNSESRITSGRRAISDGPSRYAMSQVLNSDVMGLQSVSDTLATSRQSVEVALAGAEGLSSITTQMQDVILRANEPAADLASLEAELVALKSQYRILVDATSFNGQNLLIDGDPVQALSSVTRQANGSITTDSISIRTQNFLFEAATTIGSSSGSAVTEVAIAGDGTVAAGNEATFVGTDYSPTAGDELSIEINGSTYSYLVEADDSAEDAFTKFRQVVENAAAIELVNIDVSYQRTQDPLFPVTGSQYDTITIRNDETSSISFDLSTVASGTGSPGTQVTTSLIDELSVASLAQAAQALNDIDTVQDGIASKTASLGTSLRQMEIQEDFLASSINIKQAAVESFVSVDLAEESIRLEQAQFQYELALRGLYAINASRASVLQLFS